jgi:hypothetical protein
MINAVGMPPAVYDATMAEVAEPLRRAPGFISHTAHVDNAGITTRRAHLPGHRSAPA